MYISCGGNCVFRGIFRESGGRFRPGRKKRNSNRPRHGGMDGGAVGCTGVLEKT